MSGLVHEGRCLCGAASVSARGDIKTPEACHCEMCRRQNGGGAFHGAHFSGGASVQGESVRWFAGSDWAERGFCQNCGSTLAWRFKSDPDNPSVSLGLFDEIATPIESHIFVDEGPNYTVIPDNAPHKTGAQVIAEFQAQHSAAENQNETE